MKHKVLYIMGIVLVLGLLAYVVIKPNFQDDNSIKSKGSQIYADNKIIFLIPSELEPYKTSFGSDKGIILSKFENDVAVISITIVSSSTYEDHSTFSQNYFNQEYKELLKLHPDISAMSIKTIKDELTLQNSYEKAVLINENIVFGTKAVFDTESEDFTRVVYSYSSDLDNEFESYMNTILESLKFN